MIIFNTQRSVILMGISNDSKVLVVYFSDHDGKNQTVIHKGTAAEFRKAVGEDWDGFVKGDRFKIDFENNGPKEVRVFVINDSYEENGALSYAKYFVGPADLNPNKIEYENLNFEDYVD